MSEHTVGSANGGQAQGWPISQHSKGLVLSIKAQPGAKKNEVRLEKTGQIKVCVTQRPEKGKANRVVLDELAEFLGIKASQVELLGGETSQKKRILIYGLSAEEVVAKLNGALSSQKQQ